MAGKPTTRVAAQACRRWTLGGLVALAALVAACGYEPIVITVHNPTSEEYLLRLSWSYGAACGYEPIVITVHNPTSQEYLLRLSWSYGEVHVLRVAPGTGAYTASLQSGYRPLVELLRPDCAVLGSWRPDSDLLIRIGPEGRPSAGPPEAPSPGTEPPETVTEEVAACGATQLSGPPAN